MTIGTLAVRSIVLNLYTKFEEDLMNSIVFFQRRLLCKTSTTVTYDLRKMDPGWLWPNLLVSRVEDVN